MSTHLFEELSPWYQPRVSEMVLVAFRLSEALRDRMKQSPTYQREGEGQFIREAIGEKLRSMGFEIPDEEIYRGPRTGIGGRPTHRANKPGAGGPSNTTIVSHLSGGLGDVKPVEATSLAEDSATPYRSEKPRHVKLPPYNPTPVTDQVAAALIKPKGEAAVEGTPKGKAKR